MGYLYAVAVLGSLAGALGVVLALIDHYLATYGECRIQINDEEEPLVIQGGDTLLSYLIQNEIFIPSACGGKATCGFCKLQVTEGAGPVLPTEVALLTREDVRNNVRLACQVKVKEDVVIQIPEEYLAIQRFQATVVCIEPMTHDIKRIEMKLEEPDTISFRPGQYVQFEIPGTSEYRAYSVASAPNRSDTVELIVRLVPDGLCSTYMHETLQEGDTVFLTGPYGDFYLQEDSTNEIICVAGGSGVAPIRSIVSHLFEQGTDRKVTYFFGARTTQDLYYYDECVALAEKHENFHFVPALSEPAPEDNWTGATGFIHLSVDEYLTSGEGVEAYLCGPPPMINALMGVFEAKEVPKENVLFDEF